MMFFPKVSGSNLLRQKMDLPAELGAEFNVVLVAFQQRQQTLIDTWIPFLERLEKKVDNVRYYELPVIQNMNVMARTFINEGMRAGIPDPKARERTITLYLDKEAFRRSLAMSHENDIYVLLLDRQGKVLWRETGGFTIAKGRALERVISDLRYQVHIFLTPNESNRFQGALNPTNS